jgi:hypothetical protein
MKSLIGLDEVTLGHETGLTPAFIKAESAPACWIRVNSKEGSHEPP